MNLPPILPDVGKNLESFLSDPDALPIHVNEDTTRFWDHVPQPLRLLSVELCPPSTTLNVERDPISGKLLGFKEVNLKNAGTTAKNSTSLSRAPGPPGESTKGNASNFPFWPGGFDEPELPSDLDTSLEAKSCLEELSDPGRYLTCPPGFERGVSFAGSSTPFRGSAAVDVDSINLSSLLASDRQDDPLGIWEAEADGGVEPKAEPKEGDNGEGNYEAAFEDVVGPKQKQQEVLSISKTSGNEGMKGRSSEWAEMVDTSKPFPDFHQQVPRLAFTWPFELDVFQKQAILRLERNESVFVAAHTSAGKTVVAEYAVALSRRHMTRTIYTSPIKALSNQKFRDFRETFDDVGLVTGDIQINPSAACLIMTTEILRSMLYNGSDTIRDLEYVIFDEVHYINDAERGVVWEEVLILLPDHVNIIMLSATVPNTMEFAEWVGRTKKKKIHVISTSKRPVPLEHFLYTGDSGKTKDERFLIQDAQGNFVRLGYDKAVAAKKSRETKSKTQFGSKGVHNWVNPKQEKNIWLTLVDHLSRKDKLPVVAFTLSRNRCDQNAALLTSLDLTTASEKSDIHHFINCCVRKLKGDDRKLPQVLQLTELLKRGIGIHHSGILPILKEVVEMLFQKGFVKLLFATETFAMGINMPARTVVFDNIKKHDGTEFRILKPAEYIQMAGRAGRRGLDSTGTVIILCKQSEVYRMEDLHRMMQSEPTRLESKFRLTYSMILNLLRVEQLRVEDMIKRSFSESSSMRKRGDHTKRVEELKVEITNLPETTGPFHDELSTFCTLALEFVELKSKVWSLLLSHPAAVKALSPGRIVVLTHAGEPNKIGLLLSVEKSRRKTYFVLVNGSERRTKEEPEAEDPLLLQLVSLSSRNVDSSADLSGSGHIVVEVKDDAIVDVTTKTVKVDADKVLADVKQRQMPRFKDAPPGQSTQMAVQELNAYLGDVVGSSGGVPEALSWVRDFRIQDLELVGQLERLERLRVQISSLPCCELSDFRSQLLPVFRRRQLEDELGSREFLLSEESLKYLPDYNQRLEVLRRLNYIDDARRVRLKGRVACEMGSRELLVTELVFDNVLTDRPPAEIAALLSCMVFQQKTCSSPTLTESLERGKAEVERCAGAIGRLQRECGMKVPEFVDQIHFGLVEVVHEWARGMPFGQITALTDVQEGVIVRTIQRLDETLRDVKDAARVIGDPVLYQKMDEASTIIKRDIVFAASLYTQ